jgi:hypothetical protein
MTDVGGTEVERPIRLKARLKLLSPRRRKKGLSSGRTIPSTSAEILAALRGIEVRHWSYRWDDESVLHLGPMAQDFGRAFGLGDDMRGIAPIDECGVALLAIQELAKQVEDLNAEVQRLRLIAPVE